MKARIRYRQRSASLILCGLLLLASPAFSQEAETPTVHWAYASFFGTGWYKINDQQSAFIANFAPLWKSEPATWFGEGGEGITYSLRVPITEKPSLTGRLSMSGLISTTCREFSIRITFQPPVSGCAPTWMSR